MEVKVEVEEKQTREDFVLTNKVGSSDETNHTLQVCHFNYIDCNFVLYFQSSSSML